MDTGTDMWEKAVNRYIETASGKTAYFASPVFDKFDCAAATAKLCRYTGHSRRFYSIAEHQILVSEIMEYLELGDPFEGANHDDTEYLLGDVSSPLKSLLPDYKLLEKRIDEAFREQLHLPLAITEGCKKADWLALFIEAATLVPSGGRNWVAPDGIKEEAKVLANKFWIRGWGWQEAESNWLARFNMLERRRAARTI